MLKVTVTGHFNESFKGSDKEVEKYLKALKQRQLNELSEADLKQYKGFKTCRSDNAHDHNWINKQHDLKMVSDTFRDRNKGLALKIKIETIENKFF